MNTSSRKLIYGAEFIFVVVPAFLFLLMVFPWIVVSLGLKVKAWEAIALVIVLWICGIFGVAGLTQLFVWLTTKDRFEIRYLWGKLAAGVVAAIFPVVFVFIRPADGGNAKAVLLLLFPVAIAMHWAFAYSRNRKLSLS